MEGVDLRQYLEDVFAGCLDLDCEIVIQIVTARRVGTLRITQGKPWDIVVKLPYRQVKSKIREL